MLAVSCLLVDGDSLYERVRRAPTVVRVYYAYLMPKNVDFPPAAAGRFSRARILPYHMCQRWRIKSYVRRVRRSKDLGGKARCFQFRHFAQLLANQNLYLSYVTNI